jgi:L,D-transpeptidase catalytic domain/Putative peptidoglycan binding domain
MDRRRHLFWAWLPLLLAGLLAPGASAATTGPLDVRFKGVHEFERGLVLLSGERIRVRTATRGVPAGTTVVLRYVQEGQPTLTRQHRLGVRTSVVDAHRVFGPNRPVTVQVRLLGPDGRQLARWPSVRVGVLQPTASEGATGDRVRFLQRRLAAMRYAIAVTGRYDDATNRAVVAFRKVNRMRRVSNASRAVFSLAARGQGRFKPRHGGAAHVEGDLTRQVLALVNRGGRVFKVYMTSSGRDGLHTPTGVHTFFSKDAGWNSEGMLDSSYFAEPAGAHGACAIHGYFVVPTWNASHCCFRVPVADARKIFNWVRIGERIYVYY